MNLEKEMPELDKKEEEEREENGLTHSITIGKLSLP